MRIAGMGEIVERVRRHTVLVQPGGRGAGSGVVWNSEGTIITNAHVVRSSRMEITLWDGRELTAEVSARDPQRDLAALWVSAADLQAATLADSSRIRPGEVAIAVGNPLGFLGAMSMGVVHAVAPLRGLGGRSWVQADVRLAPGNSGGPLVDVRGRVMGINTMVAGRIALAIPSNEVVRFLLGETGGGYWLGVTVQQVRLPAGSEARTGLLVVDVEPGSPAALASLLPGDILLGTGEELFSGVGRLAEALENAQGILRLRFLRGDYKNVRRVTVALASRGRRPIAA
jgi:serine protease Do